MEIVNPNPGLLREWLKKHYNHLEELENLCQELSPLDIKIYSLTGQDLNSKARNLADFIINRNLLQDYYSHLEKTDPRLAKIFFEEFSKESRSNYFTTSENPKVSEPKLITNGQSLSSYEYDVVFSFAGEEREYAEELAEILQTKGIKVFYDKYEKAKLWGKDLYQYLQSVYKDKGLYCVVFISEAYSEKKWTKHELKQIQARAFQQDAEYILPLILDDTEIPGINKTIGYVDRRLDSCEEVANLLEQKLNKT